MTPVTWYVISHRRHALVSLECGVLVLHTPGVIESYRKWMNHLPWRTAPRSYAAAVSNDRTILVLPVLLLVLYCNRVNANDDMDMEIKGGTPRVGSTSD